MYSSELRLLELRFMNDICVPVYTGQPIKWSPVVGDGTSLQVALFDVGKREERVRSGPEASAKVEIVVLDGNFDSNGHGNWSLEEFGSSVHKAGERERSLLGGNPCVNLQEGIGTISKVYFKYTSNYRPKCVFRLGAKIVDQHTGCRIREAITKSFTIKDRRIMKKRHYPLSPTDEVWRLEKIGKGGPFHKRLHKQHIRTVQDFLSQYYRDPERIRNILGGHMTPMMLEAAVNHAQTCEIHLRNVATISAQEISMDAPIEMVSQPLKATASKLVSSKFDHQEEVQHFEDTCPMYGISNTQNICHLSQPTSLDGSAGYNVVTSSLINEHKQEEISPSSLTAVSDWFSGAGHVADGLQDQDWNDEKFQQILQEVISFGNHSLGSNVSGYGPILHCEDVSKAKSRCRWTKILSLVKKEIHITKKQRFHSRARFCPPLQGL